MKPSDFFIGSREFFGALIPGLIWLAAAVLILINESIQAMLVYASGANWIGVLSFAGLALLIGTLLQPHSFSFSRMVHKFLRKAEQAESKSHRMNRFLANRVVRRYFGEALAPMSYHGALLEQTKGMFPSDTKNNYLGLKSEIFDAADELYKSERQVFTACKRSVLARSPELGRLLKETEVEVNLIGTLPLPIFFFAIGLLFHSRDLSSLPLRFNHLSWLWNFGIVITTFFVITPLLLRFHSLRKLEVRMCLESFLLVEYGMAESRASHGPVYEDKNDK